MQVRRWFSRAGRTVEAALSLLAIRLALALLPFRWTLRLLRIKSRESRDPQSSSMVDQAEEVARAIDRAARHLPLRFACLHRSFVGLVMLRRRGIPGTVHLGVRRDTATNSLRAHAWCVSGDVPVVGGKEAPSFICVAAFAG